MSAAVAVVTGGGTGVGRAVVEMLAAAGTDVIAAGRTRETCEEAARAAGGRVHPACVDVASWDSVEQLVAETLRVAGPPDLVVASAGVVRPAGMTWEVAPDEWAANVQANLVGAFRTVRAFLPGMVERGQGIIILVSSVAARLTTSGWSAYAAAKAGVDQLGAVTQAELDLRGSPVRIHIAYPGVVDSPMQETIRSFSPDEFPGVEAFRRMHEKKRLRPPEQVAQLIRWLAGPTSADLRGKVADIDDAEIRARMGADLGLPAF